MLKNYFVVAWRNLWKQKTFSFINIFGLAAGLSCCILIFLFIQNELSYDRYNVHSNNIYRIISDMQGPSGKNTLACTPAPWVPLMKKDYPEIKEYVRLLKDDKVIIGQPGEQHFYETNMLYADSTFFNVFSVKLLKGDIKKALEKPNSVVLTTETARKYFGDADPIGKTLEINSFGRTLNVEVTAISEDVPANSHFTYNTLVSLQTLGDLSSLWSFHMFSSYVLLNNNVSEKNLEEKFKGFDTKYILNNPNADGKNDIYLQPLKDIHLRSHLTGEIGTNSDIMYVYVFSGVAIFILLIACFNFSNLSTARSLTRSKEIGMRKVVGANKKQLLVQFLSETTMFAFIALLLAIVIVYLALPFFNQLSEKHLTLDILQNKSLILILILLVVFVGLAAGLYPSFILSAFRPIEALKDKIKTNTNNWFSLRKVLVTLQFVVSMVLIASTILVTKQLHFLQNKKLGFNKENVVILTLPRGSDSIRLESLKTALLNMEGIQSVSASSTIPNETVPVNQVNDGNSDLSKSLSMQMLFTDAAFVKTMRMNIIAGRDWNEHMPTDRTEGFIINEEAVKKFGWTSAKQAIGKPIQWVQPNAVLKKGIVIGVVQDFHITPLKTAVQPLVMHQLPMRYQFLYIRLKQARTDKLIPLIQNQFTSFYPKQSFEYNFLDDTLNNLYSSERKLSTIFTYFSLLAIVIACLGILGLSLFSIQQRIKEIGIRKVLGASVIDITGSFLKEFLKPVLVAAIIAIPLVWYAMNQWLNDFAYRIEISWIVFFITTAIVLLLALLTLGWQSVKAAMANPVTNLRSE